MKCKKLKMGLKYKFKKLKKLFVLFMIVFVIYSIIFSYNNKRIQAKIISDDKIYVETQKGVKMAENSEKNEDIIKTTTKDIPVCSTSHIKTYMDYKMITNKSSEQWQYINASNKIKIENGYLMEGEYIGVALGSYFGEIGTKYIFTLNTGKQIKVVKIEKKADEHTKNGCQQKWDGSVIEFVIDSTAFKKSANGYVYNGNFNNVEQFKGHIEKIEMVIE